MGGKIYVNRYRNQEKVVEVEFLTPTFLGGADQNAELRIPPFKSLIRQWWRVLQARPGENNYQSLLKAEGGLFGNVLDDQKASASQVRLRFMDRKIQVVEEGEDIKIGKIHHPEVKKPPTIQLHNYLGFGPITTKSVKKYIKPGGTAQLQLRYPKESSALVEQILYLINEFGTIGSRARNGWGSLHLKGIGSLDLPRECYTSWNEFFGKSSPAYPCGLARDQRGILCWQSKPQTDWKQVMKELGGIYMRMRTELAIKGYGVQERHLLGYPVTDHAVKNWGTSNGRMPSQIRLMVKRHSAGEVVGRILHLPHKLPPDKQWPGNLPHQQEVWAKVHNFLDQQAGLTRLGGAR